MVRYGWCGIWLDSILCIICRGKHLNKLYSLIEDGTFLSTQKRLTTQMGFHWTILNAWFMSAKKHVIFRNKILLKQTISSFLILSIVLSRILHTHLESMAFLSISFEGLLPERQTCHPRTQYSFERIAAFCQRISFHSKIRYLLKTKVSAYDVVHEAFWASCLKKARSSRVGQRICKYVYIYI